MLKEQHPLVRPYEDLPASTQHKCCICVINLRNQISEME